MDSKNNHNQVNNEQDITTDATENTPSQLDLIQQWRSTLECLKADVVFPPVLVNATDEEKNKITIVKEAIEYLDKKNTLLDDNDDFLLSESGVLKYKALHMLVFDYLSQLAKPVAVETKAKFYLVSRNKHIKQEKHRGNWIHSLIHFMFIPVVIFLLGTASLLMVKKTQENIFVIFILLSLCFLHLKTACKLLKPFKKTAVTPLKFSISLLGIHSMNTLLKVSLLCFIPIAAAFHYQRFWVDDVIIISLSVLWLFHYKPENKASEKTVSSLEGGRND